MYVLPSAGLGPQVFSVQPYQPATAFTTTMWMVSRTHSRTALSANTTMALTTRFTELNIAVLLLPTCPMVARHSRNIPLFARRQTQSHYIVHDARQHLADVPAERTICALYPAQVQCYALAYLTEYPSKASHYRNEFRNRPLITSITDFANQAGKNVALLAVSIYKQRDPQTVQFGSCSIEATQAGMPNLSRV